MNLLFMLVLLLSGPPRPPGLVSLPRLESRLVNIGEVGLIQPCGPARVRGNEIFVPSTESTLTFQVFICCDVIMVEWSTELGRDYQVEHSDDLRRWFSTEVVFEGTGKNQSWFDTKDASRFFRILVR